jgi:hypothetical protein
MDWHNICSVPSSVNRSGISLGLTMPRSADLIIKQLDDKFEIKVVVDKKNY